MKKLLLIAALALVTVGAYAQGTVTFANIGGGGGGTVNAIIRDTTGGANTAAGGAAYAAMLYVGPAGTLDTSVLTTNGVGGGVATFLTGAQAGYFNGGTRIITGFAGGTTVTLQVRAWATATGSSYETATTKGASSPIQFTLATPPATAPNMVGLQAFNVSPVVVPEPSSIALGLLGLGALALIRRRK